MKIKLFNDELIEDKLKDVGIDIIKNSRIKTNELFINRVLSNLEKQEYELIRTINAKKRFLSTIWSCKEAIFKLNYLNNFNYKNISILHDKNNKPYCSGLKNIKLSVSHERKYTIAIAILLKKK